MPPPPPATPTPLTKPAKFYKNLKTTAAAVGLPSPSDTLTPQTPSSALATSQSPLAGPEPNATLLGCDPVKSAPFFERLPPPRRGDWLTEREEKGQPFVSYIKRFGPTGMSRSPSKSSSKILLVPLGVGSFAGEGGGKYLGCIAEYCAAFFAPMEVEVFFPLPAPGGKANRAAKRGLSLKGVTKRTNDEGNNQYLISELFTLIDRETSRKHGPYCRLGVTFEDIFPGKFCWFSCRNPREGELPSR